MTLSWRQFYILLYWDRLLQEPSHITAIFHWAASTERPTTAAGVAPTVAKVLEKLYIASPSASSSAYASSFSSSYSFHLKLHY